MNISVFCVYQIQKRYFILQKSPFILQKCPSYCNFSKKMLCLLMKIFCLIGADYVMVKNKLIYKEAEGNCAGYIALLDLLNNCKTNIMEHLNNSKSNLTYGVEHTQDDLLQGDYYDIYIRKRNDWIQEIKQIQKKYETVLVNIDQCIADTRNNMASWNLRIREGKG